MNSFYKIEARVGEVESIIRDGLFTTQEAAQARIQTHAANTKDCRVVLYQRGTSKGPVRVATV